MKKILIALLLVIFLATPSSVSAHAGGHGDTPTGTQDTTTQPTETAPATTQEVQTTTTSTSAPINQEEKKNSTAQIAVVAIVALAALSGGIFYFTRLRSRVGR